MVLKYRSGIDFLMDQSLQNNLQMRGSFDSLNSLPIISNHVYSDIKWRFWKWSPQNTYLVSNNEYGDLMDSFKDNLYPSDSHVYTINELKQFSILEFLPVVNFVTDDDFKFDGDMAFHSNSIRSYYIFKDGVRPLWEDEYNLAGGCWSIRFSNYSFDSKDTWKKLISILTHSRLKPYLNQEICGVGLTVRTNVQMGKNFYKISIWIRDSSNAILNLMIGDIFKSLVNRTGRVQFFSHSSNINKQNSFKRSRFNSSSNKRVHSNPYFNSIEHQFMPTLENRFNQQINQFYQN